ncbi:MAG: 2-hydroxyacid dehydrogenase [SAR202 cluster bacterium]|nr:2-hydroxyacid dehydrogenase [SAR202 cluster bacterium]
MRVALFSSQRYDRDSFSFVNDAFGHDLVFLEPRLSQESVALARGFPGVCVFVNDQVDAPVLRALHDDGTRLVLLRSAGFNQIDIEEAARLGIAVARVPEYSPHAVTEHTIGLILSLDRKIHRAFNRGREGNFSLDGLLGFDLHGKTVGIVGTGRIGKVVVRILRGFGCRLLLHDPFPDRALEGDDARYVAMEDLLEESDVVTLHCPLTPQTRHLIDVVALRRMKPGVMLINTSRGPLLDTRAVIEALKTRHIGSLGLDVYEEEGDLFFRDLSDQVITDDVFTRLLTFPNVLVTSHQAFFTREALHNIATTTLGNAAAFERNEPSGNEVLPAAVRRG